MKVRFADTAEDDLIAIGRYIARGSVDTALQFIEKIETTCHETIGRHPEIGTKREELVTGLRLFPFYKYLIYYRLQDDYVEIIRVLHSSRDVEKVFSQYQ